MVIFVCLLAGLVLLAGPRDSGATQIRHMNPQKLAQVSTEVVRGTVTGVHSYWNAGHTKVFTETTVTVDESYKGSASGQVTVLQLGGEVDGIRVTVHGALQWTPGEEVLLFLEPSTAGKYHVAGFSQGKFAVERDPVTGQMFVRQSAPGGVELVGDDAATARAAGQRQPLQRFVADALGAQDRPGER
jgi:hypothetical protein